MPHSHDHSHSSSKTVLLVSCILTLSFVVLEAFAGILGHSLALISDAGHNFADALALILAYGSAEIAESPANASRTFGYHRATILAALLNAVSLIFIALYIFYEAYQRTGEQLPVNSHLMIGVAFVALILNGAIAYSLRTSTHDLNSRSAFMHMLGDAVAAVGVIIGGIIILVTNAYWVDPLVSVIIGVFILWSSWGIIKEAVDVLMEAAPKGVDTKEVEPAIRGLQGVRDIHDLHIWTITSGMLACSCHVLINEHTIETGQQVLKDVVAELKRTFGIGHTTIQIEIEGCDPNEMYCALKR